jgi:CheY-like chemotaxis protein
MQASGPGPGRHAHRVAPLSRRRPAAASGRRRLGLCGLSYCRRSAGTTPKACRTTPTLQRPCTRWRADAAGGRLQHDFITLPPMRPGRTTGCVTMSTRAVARLDGHPRLPPAAMRPLKTYLVEDSPVIRDSLIATLEELANITVVGTAGDEATALQWLLQPGQDVDLVIIDIFLSAGSGLGVLRNAQDLPRTVRRVVLSNYATPDMRRKCTELGAHRVFDKSHDIDALISYCTDLGTDGAAA